MEHRNMKYLRLYKEQLGMDFGKANQRLFKMMVWKMAVISGMDKCSHCKQPIANPEDLTLDHIIPWRGTQTREAKPHLFWDLDNIAFAHGWCNSGASSRGKGVREWCGVDCYVDQRKGGRYRKFRSRLQLNNKIVDLGYWDCEIRAAIAYDLGTMHYRQGCGVLNFDDMRDRYKEYLSNNKWPADGRRRGKFKSIVEHFYNDVWKIVEQNVFKLENPNALDEEVTCGN